MICLQQSQAENQITKWAIDAQTKRVVEAERKLAELSFILNAPNHHNERRIVDLQAELKEQERTMAGMSCDIDNLLHENGELLREGRELSAENLELQKDNDRLREKLNRLRNRCNKRFLGRVRKGRNKTQRKAANN